MALGLSIALVLSTPALAVVGCLTPIEELAPRSDVVVVGHIIRVDTLVLAPCPPLEPVPAEPGRGRAYAYAVYSKCGAVPLYRIAVTQSLRGEAARELSAAAPYAMFELSCDDRPSSNDMSGVYGIFFLERVDDRLWVIDGPNGVYASNRGPIADEEVAAATKYLSTHPRIRKEAPR
jgi:hypothetical protein